MADGWFYASVGGTSTGPVAWEELVERAASGQLSPYALVWTAGMAEWSPAGSVQGLAFPPQPAAPPHVDESLRWVLPVGRSGWAIAAGYFGLFAVILIGAPFAIFTGIMALRHIKRNPHLGGRGRAIFGLAMGGIFTLLYGMLIVGGIMSGGK